MLQSGSSPTFMTTNVAQGMRATSEPFNGSPAAEFTTGKPTPFSLEFNLNEPKLMAVYVDDVVRNTGHARIGDASLQADLTNPAGLLQAECTGGQGHDDIVVSVDVVTSVSARVESPLSDDDAIVFDLNRRCCVHDLNRMNENDQGPAVSLGAPCGAG